MTQIVIAVAAKFSDYLIVPIGRQLGYLFCYRSHADELRNKVQKLGKSRDDVEITVDEATRRGDQIRPIVQDWLNRVDQITGEAEKLMKDGNRSCFHGWCSNLKSRYQFGREACKKMKVIVDIHEARNFPDGVSYNYVPPPTVTFSEYESYESRASTLNLIMDALKDDETMMIGVWGMGGVGKTTLIKQVSEQAKQENLFTTQVYIDVSWTREEEKIQEGILNIQQHIAEKLGLELNEKTIPARADKLMLRLKNEKILIVLDDIWKEINLEEVGIPSKDDQKDCKIMLASRDAYLLHKDMGAQECFQIQHLQEEEAWQLFKKTTGDSVESDELKPTAREVVKECMGLPVAIVTIAKALKDESIAVWKNGLDELRSSEPTNIRGVQEKVYACLEWSYHHLKGDEVRSLFLLCGSLRYGDISMYELLRYAMGLDMFDCINSLEQARNKLVTLVTILKASSLLIEGEDHRDYFGGVSRLLFMDADDNKCVRMHDVVHDFARNIASSDPHRFVVRGDVPLECWSEINESKYISLYCKAVHELPPRLVCPKLQFLLLRSNNLSLNVPNTFFEGMNQLKVLDLYFGMTFTTLPSTLHSLENLRTLCLDWCMLGDIAVIGKLRKLQVLSMVGSNIQQLPKEMMQLTNLRLLNLNNCWQLKVIPRNILSSLSRLECLFMKSSFSQWATEEVSDEESNISCLSELNHLGYLTTIEIEIADVKLVPKDDKFFENLTSYAIFIGKFSWFKKTYKKSKTLRLQDGDGSLLLRNGIANLLKKAVELELRALKEVFCGPIPVSSFDNLKTLIVEQCHGLKFLFLLSTARDLSELEEMTINYCDAMQKIFASERKSEIKKDDHAGTHFQLFPNLRSLQLRSLPKLMDFGYFNSELETTWPGMCSHGSDSHKPVFSCQVSFSNLEKLELIDLPKLKEIWPHQLSLDSLSNLQILRVKECPWLLNLIPCHLVQSFKNLKEIEVINCEVLEHVFDLEGHDTNVEILPKLETLTLINLVGLKGIICNKEKNDSTRGCFSPFMPMSFLNLRSLSINYCGKEDKDRRNVTIPIEDGVLFGEKVSFPNLEELKLNGLSMLKMIWHPQLSLELFDKLQIISVCNCPRLVNIMPSHLIQSFKNLKEVVVRNCKLLERVFSHRGLNGEYRILPQVEILKLEDLPKLRLIFCNMDDHDNMGCLLSLSKFKDFHHLKELHVVNCGKPLDEKVSFSPKLEVLVLESFYMMKEIDFGIGPKLKILQLKKLPKLSSVVYNEDDNARKRCLLSHSMFKNFHNLKDICIIDCGKEDRRELPFHESRASTSNKILDALRDNNINLIGVVGIGGVGKTTLVKQVARQAKQQQLFTKQLYLDLSWTRFYCTLQQKVIISYIQDEIANMLFCKFEEWYSDESRRAALLKQRLKKREILVILDDIWKEIDLEQIGIPSCKDDDDETECKILLISRDGELLCKDMGAQISFLVDTLPPEEAWTLFKKTAGVCDSVMEENQEVRSIAIQVVEQCEGLPIAVVTIAKALKDKTLQAVSVWKNVLEQLRNCAMGKKVYSCLEWSYTHLKGDEAKSLLLLCGMLGGGVSFDRLLKFCIGLDCFDHMESVEQARNKLLELVEILDPSRLLLDIHEYRQNFDDDPSFLSVDSENRFVKMHDVVYDVAREIASKKPHSFVVEEDVGLEEWSKTDESKSCTFICLHCKVVHNQLPQGLVCPELQFFLLRNNNPFLNIPDTFFQGMKKLRVLDLSRMHFTTLPLSLDSLANLRTLSIDWCNNLVDIAIIGKLTKLEVLSLKGSTIQQLPNEMVQLTNLRLLDLNDCWKLEVIPRNILSSLSRLECLFMSNTFIKWAIDGESNTNACLSEINHLSHLTTLYITISDAKLLSKDILFKNLTRYVILIGYWWGSRRTDKTLKLDKVDRSLHLRDGMSKLLERSEELEFQELSGTNYVLYPSNGKSFLELKHLLVTDSPEIQYIIYSMNQLHQQHGVFPLLESLVLRSLDNLQQVWHGPIPIGSFSNLKTLEVYSCPKLRYLFLLSTARDLSQLENMIIDDCKAMLQIITCERELGDEYGGTNLELFPNLRT